MFDNNIHRIASISTTLCFEFFLLCTEFTEIGFACDNHDLYKVNFQIGLRETFVYLKMFMHK